MLFKNLFSERERSWAHSKRDAGETLGPRRPIWSPQVAQRGRPCRSQKPSTIIESLPHSTAWSRGRSLHGTTVSGFWVFICWYLPASC